MVSHFRNHEAGNEGQCQSVKRDKKKIVHLASCRFCPEEEGIKQKSKLVIYLLCNQRGRQEPREMFTPR